MNKKTLPDGSELLAALQDPKVFQPINDESHYVYALWLRGQIIYVGFSRFLEQRINQHRKLKGVKKEFDGYSFIRFDNRADALNAERALMARLPLEMNRQKPVACYAGTIEDQKEAGKAKRQRLGEVRAARQAKQDREQAEWWAKLPQEERDRLNEMRRQISENTESVTEVVAA